MKTCNSGEYISPTLAIVHVSKINVLSVSNPKDNDDDWDNNAGTILWEKF